MKNFFVRFALFALLLPMALLPVQGALLIPIRTDVAGFSGWTDENVGGTTYLQLLMAGASTTSPSMDFSSYTSVQLDFKARTYGGANAVENTISVFYSVNQGGGWTLLGTRTPVSSTMTAMEPFDLSAIRSSQVLIRFSVAGTSNSIGAGIDDISFNGFVGSQATLSLSKEGSEYTTSVFPFTGYAGSKVVLPVLPDEGYWKFMGWDANPAVQQSPAWSGGTEYTTTDITTTLYAIYSRTDFSGESWTEVLTREDILPGVYVVCNGDFYLPNAAVVNGPEQRRLLSHTVFAGNGKLLGEVADDMRWTLSGTADAMTLQSVSNGNYLFNNDAADGVNVGTTAANWAFETYGAGFAMKDASYNRYCAVYTAGTDWRSYTTRNYSSYKTNAGILQLYRLSGTATTSYSPLTRTTTWTGAVSASWNETANWSNGIPDAAKTAVIAVQNPQPVINSAASSGNLLLQPTAQLSISGTGSLTVNGDFLLKSSVEGTATFLNEGTLTVTGTSKVEQVLTARSTAGSGDQWWYFASPVSGASSAVVLKEGFGNRLGYYNETTASYPQITTNSELLEPGRGYLAEVGTSNVYTFTGTLTNGQVGPVTLTRTYTAGGARGFNLIGNPYPSFIDWNAITNYGTPQQRTDVRPTIWIRTRNASGNMVFDTFDGEVGTSLGVRGPATNYIAPMQAFWVKVNADGDNPQLTFANSICSHRTAASGAPQLKTNADGFQTSGVVQPLFATARDTTASKAVAVADRQLLRLELSSDTQRDETIIATHPEALNSYDFYDSDKMSSGNAELFCLVEGRELVINKQKRLDTQTYLQLGFRPLTAGNFRIRATELINLDSLSVILTDRLLNTEHPLHSGESYSFTSDGQTANDRFSISFRSPRILSGLESSTDGELKVTATRDKCISVYTSIPSGTIRVFDEAGKQVLTHPVTGTITRLETPLSSGTYFVKINHLSHKLTIL